MELPDLTPDPRFAVPATRERLQRVAVALRANNIATEIVSRDVVRDAVLALIPEGAEVHVGLSETMRELGITDALEGGKYLAIRPQLMKLDRTTQRREMAKLASAPDYMLGSVHAVTDDGQLIIGSGSGSQLGPYANGAGTLILVVGAQKIVTDVQEGLRRVRDYSLPLEDRRQKAAGKPGSVLTKTLIISRESPGRTHLFLLDEAIGF